MTELNFEPSDCVCIDFSQCEFSEPFPLLYLGNRILELKEIYPETDWKIDRALTSFDGFAAHIGFFDYIGGAKFLDPRLGEAQGSSRYVPIKRIDIKEVRDAAGNGPIGPIASEEAKSLTAVLLQTDEGPAFDFMEYTVREILRNALEHSEGKNVSILAQYWPTRQEAEVAIVDDGIGIADNLYDNEYLDISNNLAAIKVALMPGITGVSRDVRFAQDDIWHNSGFGLFVTSRLLGKFGDFAIGSNGDFVELRRKQQIEFKLPLLGTAVRLQLKLSDLSAFKYYIKKTLEEGEKMRSEILKDFPITASAASKMLSSQFKKSE